MKIQLKPDSSVTSNGVRNSVKFGIKNDAGLAHIFNVLRNQLYSDKVTAVMREYSTNGTDAHIEAGCPNTPIEITLPTRLNPNFSVRDFGTALNEQEIQDVYAFYGESTKRNTNQQTGMIGIGSKSAFAYGDNFVIHSFIDGKKSIYNAFIDPSQIGQISKIGEEKTDERNGVEIVVPVKDRDIEEFQKKAKKLFKYFKVKPVIKGASIDLESKKEVLFSGDDWIWTKSEGRRYSYSYDNEDSEPVAIMGNIGYPIDSSDVNLGGDDSELRNLLVGNLKLEFDIGDLEISASREKLQYTDYTRQNIVKKLRKVRDEIVETVKKEFVDCKTMFDAKCLYGSINDFSSGLYELRGILTDNLTWKGKKIDGSSFSVSKWTSSRYNYDTTEGEIVLDEVKKARTRYKFEQQWDINCTKETIVILNDVGHKRQAMSRLLALKIEQGKNVYLLQFKTKKARKEFVKETGFDASMQELSSLEKRPLKDFYGSSSSGTSYGEKSEKHSAKCFEFDFKDAPTRSYHTKKSDFWKIADLDVENESGVYVILDKFQVEKKDAKGYVSHKSPKDIARLKEAVDQAGIKFPKHIYAFKVSHRKKIENKKGWVDLYTWTKQKLEEKISSANLNQAWIDIQAVDGLHQYRDGASRHYGSVTENQIDKLVKIKGKLVDKSGDLSDFLDKYLEMKQDKKVYGQIKAIQGIANDYDVDFKSPKGVKPTWKLEVRYIQMLHKYSMLKMVDSHYWNYDWNGDRPKEIANYINVIDLCNQSAR